MFPGLPDLRKKQSDGVHHLLIVLNSISMPLYVGIRIAAIIRDGAGQFHAWMQKKVKNIQDVEVTDDYASPAAVQLASELNLRHIILKVIV